MGWVKLDVDGSWMNEDGSGGAGMILRDHSGSIIFASCRFIQRCASALEAEATALMEGVTLALDGSSEQLLVETDCTALACMINAEEVDRSPVAAMVNETQHLLSTRPHEIKIIGRDQNLVSHALARMGRELPKTAVWLGCVPDEVAALCHKDSSDSG
ncbi:hypothetical protein VPH35_132466 [Triticum aestivum]